jgi:hypothetical protein
MNAIQVIIENMGDDLQARIENLEYSLRIVLDEVPKDGTKIIPLCNSCDRYFVIRLGVFKPYLRCVTCEHKYICTACTESEKVSFCIKCHHWECERCIADSYNTSSSLVRVKDVWYCEICSDLTFFHIKLNPNRIIS